MAVVNVEVFSRNDLRSRIERSVEQSFKLRPRRAKGMISTLSCHLSSVRGHDQETALEFGKPRVALAC
jgi:hypothetical protein